MDKKEVGLRLRKFLLEKFIKLNIAAEKVGMSPQALQKYLNGDFIPGGEILSKLSQLGCDIDWLLLGGESQNTNIVNTEQLNIKDKIIISQAEELTMMRDKLEDLKQRVLELEEEQSKLIAEMGRKRIEKMKNKGNVKKIITK